MNALRTAVVGVAIAATTALAVPAGAVAQDAPQLNRGYDFQLPSFPSPFVPGRQCGAGLLGFSLVPGHASPDATGTTTFGMTFEYAGDLGGPNVGSATVGWLNLSSFESGVASFPVTDLGSPLYRSRGEVSAHTGTGQIVAIVQPNVSFAGEHCNWSFSLGTFPA